MLVDHKALYMVVPVVTTSLTATYLNIIRLLADVICA